MQQQFFFGNSGDYRLAKYSDIKVNEKIPDSVFKLKTTGKTKFISTAGLERAGSHGAKSSTNLGAEKPPAGRYTALRRFVG